MTVYELPEVVYHGTISVHKDSLMAGIDINRGYVSTDFGQGFYTTGNYEQAVQLAKGRAKAYNRIYGQNDKAYPMVISYSVNKNLLSDCMGRIFEAPDDKWKEFVYNNRVGNDFAVSNYHNIGRKYDYVYGFVADSKIVEMTKDVRLKNVTYGMFVDSLKPLKCGFYDQLSFHSDKSAAVLTILKIEMIESEVLLP
ncbi:MAG: DUF3990 domain-containing protein [Oscillospiraceae bacterium]|nr:DUF3990 domain-containing protein [Oscillospiraceae bacterium]